MVEIWAMVSKLLNCLSETLEKDDVETLGHKLKKARQGERSWCPHQLLA